MSLTEWETFYVIVGSSAAALTGLMFVVITLIGDFGAELDISGQQIDAFGTPTVVHFSSVVLQSAILSAPWPTMSGLRIALGIYASAAIIYALVVVKRARRTEYEPVFEDWLFNAVLPLVAYAAVAVSAGVLPVDPEWLLFVIAGASLLLLFVGIHNSWDTVTFIVVSRWEKRGREKAADDGEPRH